MQTEEYRRGETLVSRAHEPSALWSYAVAWALGEALGLYGLVVGLWRAQPEVSTLFFTWAISLILLFRPPAARRQARDVAADRPSSPETAS